jgi:type I restriction enzyme S subunit
MVDWQERKLGEVINLKRGYDLPQQRRKPGPFPIVSSSGITDHHAEAKVKGPGVVTGRYGTLGEVFYIEEDFWPLNTSLYVQDFKGNDPRFVSYFLRQLNFETRNAAGAVPGVNRNHLHAMDVWVPPLPVQRWIAAILSAYDELIKNNQRRIRILEEMARTLYREWFVNFRFPGHEKVPLIDSLLGSIPKVWEVKKLGDIVGYNRRATKPGPHLDERRYVPIDCLPSKSLALLEAKPIEEAQSSLQLFEKGDILFGAMRPYFHKVVVAPFAGVTRTTCFVFKPARPEWHAFATMTAFEETTVAYANAHSQGATIPYAVWDGSLAEMPLVLAPAALLRRFEKVVAPMLARISQSGFALNNLRRTRDLLLPRLLSGQVKL